MPHTKLSPTNNAQFRIISHLICDVTTYRLKQTNYLSLFRRMGNFFSRSVYTFRNPYDIKLSKPTSVTSGKESQTERERVAEIEK